MMKLRATIVACILALGFFHGWAYGSIIFPPPGYLTRESSVPLMAYVGDTEPTAVSIINREGKETVMKLTAGFNTIDVELGSGMNTIRWGEDEREIYSALDNSQAPEGFSSRYLHEAIEDCENCHAKGAGDPSLNGEVPDLCYDCHDNPAVGDGETDRTVHSPVEDGDCLSCHAPHFSSEPRLLGMAVPGLCWECHDEVSADSDGTEFASQHDPVESGDCLDCHQAHASDNPSLTTQSGAQLCTGCHDDPTLNGEGGKKPSIHDPIASGECDACHTVHGSIEKPLLISSIEKLCEECHDILVSPDSGNKFKFIHGPVNDGECLVCHDPHASDNRGMMLYEETELCFECHDNPVISPDGNKFATVHEPVNDGCLSCHMPHASDNDNFLSSEGEDLCYECHDEVTVDEEGSEYDYIHDPAYQGSCSDCHKPHASEASNLLLFKGNALCLECHTEFHPSHRDSDSSDMTKIPDDFPIEKGSFQLVCTGCHVPHGSFYESLFIMERMQLCSKCHDI